MSAPSERTFGRLVEHDERSRAYRVVRGLDEIRSVRHWRHADITDQGALGSCTCEALVGALACDPAYPPFRRRFPKVALTHGLAERLYRSATRLDAFDGAWPPDDTGSSGLAACKAARKAGYIGGYRWCFGLPDVLYALQGGPVMVGVRWYAGMSEPDSSGRVRPTGGLLGGHEVCLTGLEVETQRVWFDNSWGESWGIDGRAWISWTDLDELLEQDGDAVVPTPVVTVPSWWQRVRAWLGV